MIIPDRPSTADEIVPRDVTHQYCNILGFRLKIPVHDDDNLSLSTSESGIQGRGLAIIPVEVKHAYYRVPLLDLIEKCAAPVVASIVDEKNFKRGRLRFWAGCERLEQLLCQGAEVVHLILDGNDDRGPGTRCTEIRQRNSSRCRRS